MWPLSASELLTAWEQGVGQSLGDRAITVLAAASPETPRDVLVRLTMGQRDALLLTLREKTFGPHLAGLSVCPECGEPLELTCAVADVRVAAPADSPPSTFTVNAEGYEVSFRLPNSLDVAAAVDSGDPDAAERMLLARCLLGVRSSGQDRPFEELPPAVQGVLAERMATADPQADVRFSVACPACSGSSDVVFDIASFFWSEIDAWAAGMLASVHALASSYGWTERDILAMTPARRQAYLELIGG